MSNTMWIQTDSLKSKNSTFPKYYTIYQFFVLHASYVIPNFVINDFFYKRNLKCKVWKGKFYFKIFSNFIL